MTSIFLTGASGYIGGQVLHELVKSHPEHAIAVLVRDEKAGEKISSSFPDVRIVNGNLDDSLLVEEEALKASIVVHLAANKHIPSAEAIHRGLRKRAVTDPAYWVQISGASLLASDEISSPTFVPGAPSLKIWDDLDGIGEIRSLIRRHKSRAMDNYLLDVAEAKSQIKVALVEPPIIYGKGEGVIKQRSVQVPELAKVTLERGHAVRVGSGESRWANIHISDLGRMFTSLIETAAAGSDDDNIWGVNGIYLTGVGEIPFGDISEMIGSAAREQGLIESKETEELKKPESDTILPKGSIFFGTNARGSANRARAVLGWAPKEGSLDEDIPRAVAEEAQQRSSS